MWRPTMICLTRKWMWRPTMICLTRKWMWRPTMILSDAQIAAELRYVAGRLLLRGRISTLLARREIRGVCSTSLRDATPVIDPCSSCSHSVIAIWTTHTLAAISNYGSIGTV